MLTTLIRALDAAPVAMAITAGSDHRYVFANAAYRHLTTLGDRDIAGMTVAEAFPHVARDGRIASLDEAWWTRTPIRLTEYETDHPECGGQRCWEALAEPYFDDEQAIKGFVIVIRDITETVKSQKKIEDLARTSAEAERRLRLALDAAGMGEWDHDPLTGNVIRSPLVDRMFGFEPGEAGLDIAPFLAREHPDDLERGRELYREAIETNGRLHYTARVFWPDGSLRWLTMAGEISKDASGTPVRIVGVVSDVTEQKRIEEALREALLQKDMLLHELSHRVKNNLQVVSSLLRMQRNAMSDETARRHLSDALSRVLAIGQVYSQMLADGSVSHLELTTYLVSLCQGIRGMLADSATLEIDVTGGSVEIDADTAVPLALCINELVTNAFKHAFPKGDPGRVTVRVEQEDGDLRIEVADNGIGLPAGFDPSNARSLGLRVVNTVLRQIDASLDFGTGPAGGSRFILKVPRRS